MAIKDLDLEFENEAEGAVGGALDVDVDLSFSAKSSGASKPKQVPRARPVPKDEDLTSSGQNIASLDQARAKTTQTSDAASQKFSSNSEVAELRLEIEKLKSQMNTSKQETDIKLAVSEAEKEYLIEYISNAKVLNHQMAQVLTRIHKKVPGLAPEVGMAKRHLQEFLVNAHPKKKS